MDELVEGTPTNRDIVDTGWDFQAITFPPEVPQPAAVEGDAADQPPHGGAPAARSSQSRSAHRPRHSAPQACRGWSRWLCKPRRSR